MISHSRNWFSSILGIGFALIQVQTSQALSKLKIKKLAQSITVLIQDSQTPEWGSGVIVRRDARTYTILTARHVVAGKTALKLTLPDGETSLVKQSSIRTLPDVDLALLQFENSRYYDVAQIGSVTNISVKNSVFISGFPISSVDKFKPKFYFNSGKIFSNSYHSLGEGYALGYSNLVLPGMSGGPVFSKEGQLIGISGYASVKQDLLKNFLLLENSSISIYGTSYGIPIDSFVNLVPQIKYASRFYVSSIPTISDAKAISYFMSGVEKMNCGNFDGAIYDFTRDILKYKNNVLSYSNRGFSKLKVGDRKGALEDYNRAIHLDPNNADAYYSRGVVRYELKDHQGAIDDYDQAIQLNPNYANAYYNTGLAHQNLGNNKIAIRAFQQAADLYKSQGQKRDWADAVNKVQLLGG